MFWLPLFLDRKKILDNHRQQHLIKRLLSESKFKAKFKIEISDMEKVGDNRILMKRFKIKTKIYHL